MNAGASASSGHPFRSEGARRVDERIDAVASGFDLLASVTPVNAREAFERFRADGFERAPELHYRPLTIDVASAKRELHDIPLDALGDPVLIELYREKRREIDRQLTLLSLRDTPRFVDAGRVIYGSVEEPLLEAARTILRGTADTAPDGVSPGGIAAEPGEVLDADSLREAALAMIADYAARHDAFEASVVIRDDLPPGMMVSGSRLTISRHTRLPAHRLRALLAHEIGVHLLTYVNGDAQGPRLFRSGFAGYESTQEGLAVLAEHLVGGLTRGRLRLIGARVVGCAALLDGAGFVEVFRLLRDEHRFDESTAFTLTLRLFRSGGFVKDAIYLRGLLEVLEHLGRGRPLEPFWRGKVATAHLPLVDELDARGLLTPPPLHPLFAESPEASTRLEAARRGLAPLDLVT